MRQTLRSRIMAAMARTRSGKTGSGMSGSPDGGRRGRGWVRGAFYMAGGSMALNSTSMSGCNGEACAQGPLTPPSALALQELRAAADAQRRRLEICQVRTPDQLSSSLEQAVRAGATGLTTLEDPLLLSLRRQIIELTAK